MHSRKLSFTKESVRMIRRLRAELWNALDQTYPLYQGLSNAYERQAWRDEAYQAIEESEELIPGEGR